MSGRKQNPLNHRFLRDLKTESGKYAVIFLLLVLSISFVSGFLVADHSMIVAYDRSFETYHIEHGHFRVRSSLNRAQEKAVRKNGVSLYENFYVEEPLDNGSTLRLYKNRTEVNLVCLMEGRFPEAADETAVDRMYASNNKLSVGDRIRGNGHEWTITGLVALPDYSALFQDNNDSMFDSIQFGVGVVSPDGFEAVSQDNLQYCYAWRYPDEPADETEEDQRSAEFLKKLSSIVRLEDYVPRYQNQAITFTGEDMGSDKVMMEVLLYIIIVIIAFVFAVTIKDTIRKESAVIGTLLASGYTKGELLRHYMTMPVIVTVIASVFGNILGYTWMKEVCAAMYYNSYSLTTYVTIWNAEAFIKTTLIPVGIVLGVTGFILYRQLAFSPLKFLRRDLSRRKNRRAFPLLHRIPILSRFRTRIILQNFGSYAVLFCGILFANLLLMFGMQLPKLLDIFENLIVSEQLAEYQYILKMPLSMTDDSGTKLARMMDYMEFLSEVETENPDAEKFSVSTLETPEIPGIHKDNVMLYGIDADSRYVPLPVADGRVFISRAYSDKYGIHTGDDITLNETYSDNTYTFHVDGIADYMASVCIFMERGKLNRTFDLPEDTFAGYFTNSEITDIKPEYIGTIIDSDSLTKASRQLQVSMGEMMYLVDIFAVLVFIILIYLLSKMIIEKNAQSISITKILGFTDGEISRLYIFSTTLVVIFSMAVTIILLEKSMVPLFEAMMREMVPGWIPIILDRAVNIQMFGIGLAAYAVVAVLEMRRIRRTPMEEALKNVE